MRLAKWRSHCEGFLVRQAHSHPLPCCTGMVCWMKGIFGLVEWILGACAAVQSIGVIIGLRMMWGFVSNVGAHIVFHHEHSEGARMRGYCKNEAKGSNVILTLACSYIRWYGTMKCTAVTKITVHLLDWPLQCRNSVYEKQASMDGQLSDVLRLRAWKRIEVTYRKQKIGDAGCLFSSFRSEWFHVHPSWNKILSEYHTIRVAGPFRVKTSLNDYSNQKHHLVY